MDCALGSDRRAGDEESLLGLECDIANHQRQSKKEAHDVTTSSWSEDLYNILNLRHSHGKNSVRIGVFDQNGHTDIPIA